MSAPKIPTSGARSTGSSRFSGEELLLIRQDFAVRLKDAFDGATNAEIARRLNANDSTIKYYVDGDRLPVFEMIVEIGRVTGCNLHWLLSGHGPKRAAETIELFTESEAKQIREAAQSSGRSFEAQVRVLTIAALELHRKIS